MNDVSVLHSNLQGRFHTRSMGAKLIMVCGLALLMTIPAFFVSGLVDDRTTRASDVIGDISSHVGGPQTFLGPTLAIPYSIPARSPADSARRGTYLVFPAQASAVVKTSTEERHRSLFKVPVYQADLRFDATFDLTGVPNAAPQGAELDWSRAEIVVGASDARGALADATLATGSDTKTLAPSQIAENICIGRDQGHPAKLALFGTTLGGIARPNVQFHATSLLRFSGAERIVVLAYGKTTHVTAQGDWPNPGFDGTILPVARNISNSGFTAEWSVPFIARGVRTEGTNDSIHLRVAIDYSSRDAIARAAANAATLLSNERLPFADAIRPALNETLMATCGDVDLLIRTGGEKRLSDFLLWESAYAELLFTDRMWPDFNEEDLDIALEEFHHRERRYGTVLSH